ncbi:MAG: glutamate ligase domain-containing protein, partial [Hyphomicrobiales bacterium]
VGADLEVVTEAFGTLEASNGRGQRHQLAVGSGSFTLIDESYNANPASMRAALALLGMSDPGVGGRRIAVLGDMLELGEEAPRLHADLASAVDDANADIVYACGPGMAHLWDALTETRRGVYAEASDGLEPALLDEVGAGDVVMIKGSLGSRMGPLVEALCAKHKPHGDGLARGTQR